MSKALLSLLGGVVIGVAATLAVVKSQSSAFDIKNPLSATAAATDNAAQENILQRLSAISSSLDNTALRLEESAGRLATASHPGTAMQKTKTFNNRNTLSLANESAPTTKPAPVIPVQAPPVSNTPAAPPTPEQTELYTGIQTRLYAGANDPSADLSSLIKEADALTESQRQELRSIAVQMIERGELSTQQFSGEADTGAW
jgi:hypothetical protein